MFLTTQDSPALTFSDCDYLGNLYWMSYRLFSRRFSVSVIVKKCFCFCHSEALNALNLTALSDRRAHLCQVYIDRLLNENHPLHFLLPKLEEVVHIILDLALAAPRVLPEGPSARKSLSRISIPSGLYNYIF